LTPPLKKKQTFLLTKPLLNSTSSDCLFYALFSDDPKKLANTELYMRQGHGQNLQTMVDRVVNAEWGSDKKI